MFCVSAAVGGSGVDGYSGSIWWSVHREGLCHHLCPQHHDQLNTGDWSRLIIADLNTAFSQCSCNVCLYSFCFVDLQSVTEHSRGRSAAATGLFTLAWQESARWRGLWSTFEHFHLRAWWFSALYDVVLIFKTQDMTDRRILKLFLDFCISVLILHYGCLLLTAVHGVWSPGYGRNLSETLSSKSNHKIWWIVADVGRVSDRFCCSAWCV